MGNIFGIVRGCRIGIFSARKWASLNVDIINFKFPINITKLIDIY